MGQALERQARRSDTYATAVYGEVPLVDAVATHDAETGATAVFLVNRSLDRGHDACTVDVADLGRRRGAGGPHPRRRRHLRRRTPWTTRSGSASAPNERATIDGGALTVELPPVSWTAISLG